MIGGNEAGKESVEEQVGLASLQTPHMEHMETPTDNYDC